MKWHQYKVLVGQHPWLARAMGRLEGVTPRQFRHTVRHHICSVTAGRFDTLELKKDGQLAFDPENKTVEIWIVYYRVQDDVMCEQVVANNEVLLDVMLAIQRKYRRLVTFEHVLKRNIVKLNNLAGCEDNFTVYPFPVFFQFDSGHDPRTLGSRLLERA